MPFQPLFRFVSTASASTLGAVLCLIFGALAPHPVSAAETVLEDSPGRLVLEVEVSAFEAVASNGGGSASRLIAPGFIGPVETGAPDLPWMRFQVATGDRMPTVVIEPLEWVDVSLPGALAGVPRWITPSNAEPAHDAQLFAAAQGINPQVSEISLNRGLRLRAITFPVASYSGGAYASLMKKFRVRIDFPGPGSAPNSGVRSWLEFAGVKNPNGGQYLTALLKTSALARRAATQAITTFDPSAPRIKITIGDRELDGLDEDGVYALTYSQVASLAGTGLIGTSVSTLRMYAGPQDTATRRLDTLFAPTLREIPLEVRDANANTTFDAGDTILFYAHGTSIWKPYPGATGAVRWEFKNDPWSFENRYYLQWGGVAGVRIPTAPIVATPDTVSKSPYYLRAERDLLTGSCDLSGAFDAETGFIWSWFHRFSCTYGSVPGFGNTTPTLTRSQLRRPATDSLAGRASDSVFFGFFAYGGPQANSYVPWSQGVSLPFATQNVPGAWYAKTTNFFGNATDLDSVKWGANIRFDGYSIRYDRSLAWLEGRQIFPAVNGARVAYRVTGAPATMRVLRIDEGVGARWLAVSALAGSAAAFSDSIGPYANVRYVLFASTPLNLTTSALALEAATSADGVITNLRDGSIEGVQQDPEYLILAPAALLPEAVLLRNYRQSSARLNPMVTAVVRIEDVYRDWSGGRLSPVAIRNLIRWAAKRWGAGDAPGRLKYVVFFGDGNYDYRNILNGTTAAASPNHIPPFNWLGAESDANPMSTDDFYGVIDSGANWDTSPPTMAIGRLPMQTRTQAAAYLDKIARYENPVYAGEWRSRILLTADDQFQRGNVDNAGSHTEQAEDLGNKILGQDPGLRAEKIYLSDYLSNAAGLKPEATQDLINQYNRGVLFSTYFGHGAYNQMADEVLLKTNDGLSRIRNPDRSFFMTLFSCTVGRFDKLADEGMSEQFLRQKDYGAIGTLSASRESYADVNAYLGNAFSARVFSATSDTSIVTVGRAVMQAKNAIGFQNRYNNQKYVLQGEPVLVLSRPGVGLQLQAAPDTLQALGCDSIRGKVTRGSGRGAVSVRIVSGDIPKTYPGITGSSSVAQKRGKILFERTVPYVDSVFALQYFIPRDVPFGDSTAKIQVFAWDSTQLRESAVLVSNIRISGTATSSCMINDQRGPRIAVSGCNSREAGETDFPDKVKIGLPYCLQISVSDTGGGVLAGEGPDQGTTVQVVGSIAPFQPQAGEDELAYKTYQVTLSKQDISEGSHLLKISALDGFGNLSQRAITLQVSQDTILTFVRAFNVPNPLKRGETTFWFSTTLPDDEGGALQEPLTDRLRFDLRVFNQSGYLVREFRNARSGETRWDGRDAWGQTLANGVYFYDVTVTWNEDKGGPVGGRSVSRKNTLVISR